MTTDQTRQLSQILSLIADELDVPQELQDEAVAKYEHLGEYSHDYARTRFASDSRMYVQGSFGLGTPIRPVRDGDEYDVDLVFERDVLKSVGQNNLKQQVGEMLHQYADDCSARGLEVPRVEEKRRCWTLDYDGRFHMDVLPAIPNKDAPPSYPNRILITDQELTLWQASDPLGYRDWFRSRMKRALMERRAAMAKDAGVEVEAVPEYAVRTPLQRVVQILKRHRDLRYDGPRDYKPASIIITTLAAQGDVRGVEFAAAVTRAADSLSGFSRAGVKYELPNPVDGEENFADKWNEDDRYAAAFHAWATTLMSDLAAIEGGGGLDAVLDGMKPAWGEGVVTRAGKRYGDEMLAMRKAGALHMGAGGVLGASGGTQVRGHEFHGELPPPPTD